MARAKQRHEPGLLERAIALAVEAHAGHRNASGRPYLLHPLRVMMRVDTETEQAVAVLHDAVENAADRVTLESLRRDGYPEEVVDAVDRLTRREGESYEAFVERIAPSELARRVKLADLADNLDPRVLVGMIEDDVEGTKSRLRAWRRLGGETL
jgi:(p)ppGpp synthase/HD superfamily hydrolase